MIDNSRIGSLSESEECRYGALGYPLGDVRNDLDYWRTDAELRRRAERSLTWRAHRANDNLYIRLFYFMRWLVRGSAYGIGLCLRGQLRVPLQGWRDIGRGLRCAYRNVDIDALMPVIAMSIWIMFCIMILIRMWP